MFAKLKILAASGLLFPTAVLAQATPPGAYRDWADWPGPWHMMGWSWGMGWIFPLFMLFAIALCVYFMTRMLGGHGPVGHHHASSALETLNERFAKGEISREEFEEKRAVLVRRP